MTRVKWNCKYIFDYIMTAVIFQLHIATLGLDKSINSSTYHRAANPLTFEQILVISLTFEYFLRISDIFGKQERIFDQCYSHNIDFLLLVVVAPNFFVFSKHAAVESETNILFHENV